MSGGKAWLAVALAFILGAGVVLTATKLLPGSPATSVDPIRLQSPTDVSGDDEKDDKKDGKKKREKGTGEPSGTREQPSSRGAPPAPPAPPAPAGDDDDGGDDGDD